MIRAIVAVDEKWGIGKKNGLLFDLPLDMKFFRETTSGKTVCMGYNTLLSFPNGKPLKNRKNIVICPDGVTGDGFIAAKPHFKNSFHLYRHEICKTATPFLKIRSVAQKLRMKFVQGGGKRKRRERSTSG